MARGWLDHVAFAATDIASVRRRLDAAAIAYDINEVPQSGDAQIFLRDPAGIGVELNFKT